MEDMNSRVSIEPLRAPFWRKVDWSLVGSIFGLLSLLIGLSGLGVVCYNALESRTARLYILALVVLLVMFFTAIILFEFIYFGIKYMYYFRSWKGFFSIICYPIGVLSELGYQCKLKWKKRVQWHHNQMTTVDALQQRINGLIENDAIYRDNLVPYLASVRLMEDPDQNGDQDYIKIPADHADQDQEQYIKELRGTLSKHLLVTLNEWQNRKQNAVIQEYTLLQEHRYKEGYSAYWYKERLACAELGGCCGRSCGCCEKPLREYYRYKSSGHNKELIKHYGHCSLECSRCITTHGGAYTPDMRLPPVNFVPGKE